ncbi:MAG TPA: radical SAM protein [Halanaerobiales bacterium]|nr:radical SAM protein [Halanaerobiales bacterium]
MEYLYGPVPSRRLGLSLGIDLIPYKICSFNCIYCECGETTNLTSTRKEFKPVDKIIAELDEYLQDDPELDYITFSGSGEPTLYLHIGKIIDFLKENYPKYDTALLTNSSLLSHKEIREELKNLDLIVPSLDSVIEENYQKINRPHQDIKLTDIIDGLIKLREEFSGKIFLEVFIVPGINDNEEEYHKFKEVIEKIKPDRVQLNTLDRPGTEDWVEPALEKDLNKAVNIIGKKAEIIGKYSPTKKKKGMSHAVKKRIVETIRVRPCTVKDLSEILDLHVNEVNKYLREIDKEYNLKMKEQTRGRFYFLSKEE